MDFARRSIRTLELLGLELFVPLVRLAIGDEPGAQLRALARSLGAPLCALLLLGGAWSFAAARIVTSIGQLPGPTQVAAAFEALAAEHRAERAREAEFDARMEEKRAEALAAGKTWRERHYVGAPTFLDQIVTSLETVFTGFLIASLLAIPLGILCGTSATIYAALNPVIQVLRPVSPLAWLPIVMIVVSALSSAGDPLLPRSFVSSAVTVALCSLWPTLVNTALGVSSVERDHWNVAHVLRLGFWARVRRIVLPSALPWIWSGLRLSLGVGWMVLIAAEMLAQNPGLGKFVWDMFQNGSSDTLARIMVAVLAIGGIGFALDRVMTTVQRALTHDLRAA